jgi:hypothetical protein
MVIVDNFLANIGDNFKGLALLITAEGIHIYD